MATPPNMQELARSTRTERRETVAAGNVTYTLSAFKRARFVERGGPLILEVPGGELTSALSAFEAAVSDCNDYMEQLELRDIWGRINAPVPTPAGPMALVTECEPAKALTLILERLRDQLETRGIAGTLRPGRTTNHQLFDNTVFPCAGVGMFLPIDEDQVLDAYRPASRAPGRSIWAGDAGATAAVVNLLSRWALEVGGTLFVRIGATQITMDAGSLPQFVTATLPAEPEIAVRVTPHDRKCRHIAFSAYGGAMAQDFDLDRGCSESILSLTQLMRTIALDTRGAFLRRMGTSSQGREDLRTWAPVAPVLDDVGAAYWLTSHLEGDFVYDAFASQVLTGSQLTKTADLDTSRWSIEDLGDDRHLVSHRQPGHWFGGGNEPGEGAWHLISPVERDVLEQARLDFGSAIMRATTVEEHPPSLPREEQFRALSSLGLIPR